MFEDTEWDRRRTNNIIVNRKKDKITNNIRHNSKQETKD